MDDTAAVTRRRGSVLLVTVLLVIVASGVAFVAVRGSLSIEASETSRVQILQQTRAAAAGHQRMQSDLTVDPLLMLRQVLEGEADRYCNATGTTFPAGEAWPRECGASWSYLPADQDGGILVAPPTATDRDLRLLTLLQTSQGQVALESRYRQGTLRPFLHAEQDLDLSGLSWLTPSGLITAGGDLTLGTQDDGDDGYGVIAGGAITAAESPGSVPVRQLAGGDAREVIGRSLSGGLPATWSQIRQAACAVICLEPGGPVRGVDGSTVTIPTGANSIRIGLHGGRATLHASTEPLTATTLSGAAFATPGGDDSFWGEPLVTLDLPEAGLIGTDLDVVLAPCLDGELGCGTYNRSFTLMAGSAGRPAVLALAGQLTGQDGARSGVAVHGSIIRAPWNPGLNSDSIMQMSAVILDTTATPFGIYGAVPANQNAWENHTTRLQGSFAFDGSPDLNVAGLQLTHDPAATRQPPPWWPGGDLEPVRTSSRLLDPQETILALAAMPQGPYSAGNAP